MTETEEPQTISCTDLAKAGYPYTYRILQQGLEAIGWRYDIYIDCWRRPDPVPDPQLELL